MSDFKGLRPRNIEKPETAVGIILIVLVLAFMLVTSCGGEPKPNDPNEVDFGWGVSARAFTITTPSGREIECVAIEGNGLSCDWGER